MYKIYGIYFAKWYRIQFLKNVFSKYAEKKCLFITVSNNCVRRKCRDAEKTLTKFFVIYPNAHSLDKNFRAFVAHVISWLISSGAWATVYPMKSPMYPPVSKHCKKVTDIRIT